MNKITKIRLNYLIGFSVSALLCYLVYRQFDHQAKPLPAAAWTEHGHHGWLFGAVLLLAANLGLEAWRWHLLAARAGEIRFRQSARSFLAGMAFSFFTPNRLGEYPGRMLYLPKGNTLQLVRGSFLGASAQLIATMIYGVPGLAAYGLQMNSVWMRVPLLTTAVVMAGALLVFFRIDAWKPQSRGWLSRYFRYGRLLRRFDTKLKLEVMGISMLRVLIFTTQYLMLLRWSQVPVPWAQGYLTAWLFFWAMAIIPSVSLAELGIRGSLSVFFFHAFTANTAGIVKGTLLLWCMNLALPAVLGTIILIRLRLVR